MFKGFRDRREAGRLLSDELSAYAFKPDTIVLALPRGGVPVGFEVARALHLPLDVLVVRKLGVPGQEEFAFGAIASGGACFLNQGLIKALHLNDAIVTRIVEKEQVELNRREQLYRGDGPVLNVRGKTVILVDDGLATGSTMRVAVKALRDRGAKAITVAVPVAASATCNEFRHEPDEWCVCTITPEPFYAVGLWYEDFSQTTDDEVRSLLTHATAGAAESR